MRRPALTLEQLKVAERSVRSATLDRMTWLSFADECGLTEAQTECLHMRANGRTYVEIGQRRNTSAQAALNTYRTGIKNVAAALVRKGAA